MGTLYGKKEHLERFKPYKVRPATNVSPGIPGERERQVHELIAGIGAAVDLHCGSWDGKCDGKSADAARGFGPAYAATSSV